MNAGMAGIDERQHAAGVGAWWAGWEGGWSWWEWVVGASAGPARDGGGGGGGAPPPSLRSPFPFPTKPTPARASQSPNQSKSSISLAHAPCLLALGATGRGSAGPRARGPRLIRSDGEGGDGGPRRLGSGEGSASRRPARALSQPKGAGIGSSDSRRSIVPARLDACGGGAAGTPGGGSLLHWSAGKKGRMSRRRASESQRPKTASGTTKKRLLPFE